MIKLLVVDDSALVRKLIGQVFADDADVEVRFARDGAEALAQLGDFAPDVITLDIEMPVMDGLSCLDQIMVQRPTAVVMVSSLTTAGAEATLEALALGAVDFAAKPAGAISLHMEVWGSELATKVRAAARARLRTSLRLGERLRQRSGVSARRPAAGAPVARTVSASPNAAVGDGLVLIGTSTGGPPALEAVLTQLPADFPWPIVVAQHMPANFTGALARRLDGICAVEVVEVARASPLKAGVVYIGRGDADVVISRRGGALTALSVASTDYPWHPSADRLVRSALNHLPAAQLIGVLMTGMGNDGASAMTLLHDQGGRVIAESEDTAVVWGMPGELVKSGGADWVETLPMIAERLRGLVPCP